MMELTNYFKKSLDGKFGDIAINEDLKITKCHNLVVLFNSDCDCNITVNGDLIIESNRNLKNLKGIKKFKVSGKIIIRNNRNLVNIGHLTRE